MSWIACSERMPEDRRYVLVCAENTGCEGDFIRCSGSWDSKAAKRERKSVFDRSDGWSDLHCQCGKVTHWQPLPPPPTATDKGPSQ